ncbi:M48 family metalloprotease [Atopomonas sediminilitoris]|uniref:M48 family metalloprotease n=1 Tax=Atopomonas sediminilitoris TaxID=2919919 RepID=UPI001F4ED947|nr:M48 family metalloprotease [Atopomonas sediminilitoris]MCJ8170399.1 M48 family metalloprotease [Atopomonas sediminilitoris]
MSGSKGWLALVLLSGMLALSGCAVNPATGQTDFVMMSEQEEVSLGQRYHQEVLKQYSLVEDKALRDYVERIGQRMARASHRSNLNYQFTVVDSPEINAFALPGGYIYIHRGLMSYLNSEAELAAVLGHEIGHVTARHSVRQHGQSSALSILANVVAIGTGYGAAGDLTNVLGTAVVRGYGRDMELEADGLGAQYLARAGYDPQAMIQVVRVLKAQEDFARARAAAKGQEASGGYHGLFDTHPDNDRRLQEVIGKVPGGGSGEVGREAFLKRLNGVPFGDSAASGVRRGQRFYHAELNFTLEYPAGWGIVNQPDKLIGHTQDDQAFIIMGMEDRDERLTPEEFLRKKVGRQSLVEEFNLKQAGLSGYAAMIPGDKARRLAVVYHGKHAYMFVAAVKGRAPIETQDDRFMQVIRSFRPLTSKEKALAQPLRIRLHTVKAGETIRSLAGSSKFNEDGESQLRLLNGLYPSGEVKAGQVIKIVR